MEKALKQHLPKGKFQHVSETRSTAMAAVRGRGNKTTERRLRMALVKAGIEGWTVQPKGIKGNPDFYFPKANLCVFVDGCFWHGCAKCGHIPRANNAFWRAKIERNRQRDKNTTAILRRTGYRVLRIWEHELSDNIRVCTDTIRILLAP